MKHSWIYGTIAFLTFISCTAPINIETRNSKPVIVIYGCISDGDDRDVIYVTSSSPYFDEATNRVVSNAEVSVSAGGGKVYPFHFNSNGYYRSEKKIPVMEGVTYKLTVVVDFDGDGVMETYEAQTTVPPTVHVDSVSVRPINIMGTNRFSLNLFMQDPVDEVNHYLFKFFINDTLSNNALDKYITAEDRLFNGARLDGITLTYFEDRNDIHHPKREDGEQYEVESGDKVRLQAMNIEKGYYDFILQCNREKRGENPFFGGPPSNIITNITNNAAGYFTGYTAQEVETTVF